jgi:hypothetical protein
MVAAELVLRVAAGQAVVAGHRFLDHTALRQGCEDNGVPHDAWFAALIALREQGLVQMRDYDGRVALLQLTPAGLWAAVTAARDDLDTLTERLLKTVRGADAHATLALGAALGESPLLVEALLDQLVAQGRIVYSRLGTDAFRIHRV